MCPLKVKVKWIYIAPSRETSKALRHGSHSVTCNYTNACLYLVSFHQMAPPRLRLQTSNCSLLLIYRPRKDERLSRPSWLTYSGRFIHISGYPSAAGRAQDRERSRIKDQRSTAVPRNQPMQIFDKEIVISRKIEYRNIVTIED